MKPQGVFLQTNKNLISYFHHRKELGFCKKKRKKEGKGGYKETKICERNMDQWKPNLAITIQLGFTIVRPHHFGWEAILQANPTCHLSPASVLHSRQLVQMQLFVAGGVPIPSAMSPLFEASAVALQHQPLV